MLQRVKEDWIQKTLLNDNKYLKNICICAFVFSFLTFLGLVYVSVLWGSIAGNVMEDLPNDVKDMKLKLNQLLSLHCNVKCVDGTNSCTYDCHHGASPGEKLHNSVCQNFVEDNLNSQEYLNTFSNNRTFNCNRS